MPFCPIRQQNQLFQFDSVDSSWKQVASPPDDPLTSFDAIAGGWLFGIGASGNIWEYDSSASSWNQFPNPPPTAPMVISCGEDRTLWVLGEDKKIYQYNYSATTVTERWIEIGSGSLMPIANITNISIANITNAFAISATGQIIKYTYEMSFWGIIPELIVPDPAQIASVDSDNFFVIGGKWLWGYGLNGAWVSHQLSENLISVSADSEGNGWVLDAQGKLYLQRNIDKAPLQQIDGLPANDFIQVSALCSSDDRNSYLCGSPL